MAIRSRRPTSPGRRFQTSSDFSDITKSSPERTLLAPSSKSGGRNNYGRKTSRHRGGGHKRRYRVVDFRRVKDGVAGRVAAVEYDPNRTCRIALIHYTDGEKAYILAPKGLSVGDTVMSGQGADIRPGNAMALRYIPVGTVIHNVELRPGQGGKIGRSAGIAVQLVAKDGDFATLRMPSTEMRRVLIDCRATVGEVGNSEHELVKIGKAGRNRWKGVRPQTRGVAMNPVDHPLGGGEGRTSGGRPPFHHGVSQSAVPATRTSRVSNSSSVAVVPARAVGESGRGRNLCLVVLRRGRSSTVTCWQRSTLRTLQESERSSRPGHVAPPSFLTWSGTRSPFMTVVSTYRCTSRSQWSVTNSVSSARHAPSSFTPDRRRGHVANDWSEAQ